MKINQNLRGDEEEGDGVRQYTKIHFGRRFGLEDQILLRLARKIFVYTSYLYIDYLWSPQKILTPNDKNILLAIVESFVLAKDNTL